MQSETILPYCGRPATGEVKQSLTLSIALTNEISPLYDTANDGLHLCITLANETFPVPSADIDDSSAQSALEDAAISSSEALPYE